MQEIKRRYRENEITEKKHSIPMYFVIIAENQNKALASCIRLFARNVHCQFRKMQLHNKCEKMSGGNKSKSKIYLTNYYLTHNVVMTNKSFKIIGVEKRRIR